ncbi:MAG: thiamine phosphate synthase [Candidatus Bipolaricaulota bacterium]|nr:thiamine phosphate synthase [Candidatus Bipolaricaulota bacterium]MDW8031300.1 thiamine phosphate synthase [Candidatus Bipolaricaulota bacterium]
MTRKLGGLYLVVSPDVAIERVEAALRGGADLLQIWSPAQAARDWAAQIRKIARTYNVPLLVNNDIILAAELAADGLHLDGNAPTPSKVRQTLGSQAIVGYTCGTNLEKVLWAERVGADYVSFCAVFPSPSVQACDLVPLETIRQARRLVSIPIFASGGITLENAHKVIEAGADGIAVISAVFQAPDPEEAVRRFKALWTEQRYA